MITKKTKKQHFVSQFYLKKWSDKNGMIKIKGDKTLFMCNSINIGHVNSLYRVEGIGVREKELLLLAAEKTAQPMQGLLKTIIHACHLFKTLSNEKMPESANNELDILKQNIIENFYQTFEDQVQRSYTILINGTYEKFDINYYQDILHFVTLQLTRTPKVKILSREIMQPRFLENGLELQDFDTIHSAIIAENLTLSLIEKLYQIEIIENHTQINFITSDNPVKNLLSIEEKKVELYWPISPRKCIIIKPTNYTEEQAKKIKSDIIKLGKKAEHIFKVTKEYDTNAIQELNKTTWHNKSLHIYYIEDSDITDLN